MFSLVLFSCNNPINEVRNSDDQGRLHGKQIGYYPDGKLKVIRFYEHGIPIGEYYSYYEDGNIKLYMNYYKSGEVSYLKEYDENGNLIKRKGSLIIDQFFNKNHLFVGEKYVHGIILPNCDKSSYTAKFGSMIERNPIKFSWGDVVCNNDSIYRSMVFPRSGEFVIAFAVTEYDSIIQEEFKDTVAIVIPVYELPK